jgi:hypothetical protein
MLEGLVWSSSMKASCQLLGWRASIKAASMDVKMGASLMLSAEICCRLPADCWKPTFSTNAAPRVSFSPRVKFQRMVSQPAVREARCTDGSEQWAMHNNTPCQWHPSCAATAVLSNFRGSSIARSWAIT